MVLVLNNSRFILVLTLIISKSAQNKKKYIAQKKFKELKIKPF